MSLNLRLDRNGKTPLYRQIADQIQAMIRAGRLHAGERLPTIRALGDELEITRLTVHRAFRELGSRGCLEATVGRGSFVRSAPVARGASTVPSGTMTADAVMADIQKYGASTGMRNLAHSEPDPALIPADQFWDCLESLRSDAAAHVQYVSPQGDLMLREQLTVLLRGRGISAAPEEILVTSGVTQGMSLVAQALARPGDRVVVEQPTYLGLLHILEAQGLRPVGLPLDREGPRLDLLERIITSERPRFFYTIPTFHNPTGRSMSMRRRRELLALAARHGLLLVEDDIYHRMAYDRPPPRALKSLDDDDHVIYLDGLSKAILPGVRSGFAVAPRPLLERMLSLRRAADLCGPSTLQRAMAEFLRRGHVNRHIKKILPRYKKRRDALMAALKAKMPRAVTWTHPEGGFSCWLTLPPLESMGDLYRAALDRGVVFSPGEVFLAEPGSAWHLRLCFGRNDETVLREGVSVLAELIRERLNRGTARRRLTSDQAPLV